MTTTTTTPKDTTPPTQVATNVNTPASSAKDASMWTTSRMVALVFTVIEVLLLVRVAFKLFGANAAQGFVAAIYGITEPLVAPFRGIFGQPDGTSGVEIAAFLSIVFFMLVAALVVALVRAFTGRRSEHGTAAS
jgi:YggT family protein